MRSPFCCLSDEALFILGRQPGGIWGGLNDVRVSARLPESQRETASRALRFLQRWRGLKDRLPIARLLGEILADSGYDAALQFEFLGDRKLANLWKLVELARTFDRSGLFGLSEFIQRLGDLVRSQPREEQAATQPENANVVRLMSIHQAKGLEFPVVFVPDFAAEGRGGWDSAAQWHAQLGCVVKPPPDEDPPPFSDFGWKLRQASEEIEDWHEDLRTLYVACTRAQDYLVLSAALPEPIKLTNAWMLTLAESFELPTGRCLVAGLPETKVPMVRVSDDEESLETHDTIRQIADASFPSLARRANGKTLARRASEGKLTAAALLAAQIAPILLCLRGKRIVTVAELEHYLRYKAKPEIGKENPLRSTDFGFQFDAEDGSDRGAWPDRETRRQGDKETRRQGDKETRRQGDKETGRQGDRETRRPGDRETRRQGDLLSASALPVSLSPCLPVSPSWENIEFLLDLFPSPAGSSLPIVRGVIDRLWQDAGGEWHMLMCVAENVSHAEMEGYWQSREPALVLAARAVEQRLGTWPGSITVQFRATGEDVTRPGSSLRRDLLTGIAAALSEIAELRLPE